VVFDDTVDASSMRRFELEADLRQAVKKEQLRLFYQPELDLVTGRVVGFEALVRWEHPTRGLVPPNDFIPLAEETGEIVAIGQWVLAEACRQTRAWQSSLPQLGRFTMAVNLSAKEFMEPDLTWRVAKTLRNAGVRPDMLRIEITESVLMRDVALARKVFFELKGLGVEIAIDDFGTGYSSLNYLRRLPTDVLKVDRSFVTDVDHDEREASIVRAVVNVAKALDLKVVAEGIERPEQVQILADIGCSTAQGFYFSRPQPAELMTTFVGEHDGQAALAS
jgi:EAL domain-containing protein (putative c-di-GMP-specific phosphodiesterase class I)